MNSVAVSGSVRAEGRLDRINQAVRVFEETRDLGGAAGLEGHWRGAGREAGGDVAVLAALVKADLRLRFGRGESPAVAEYIERFPELRGSDSRVLSLIYEEFCLHEEGGRPVGVESFCERYPDWKDSLASQLQYHQLISRAAGIGPPAPTFPEPGEYFGEFELISILGTGGSSRVFLARDTSLGDRVVVLKVAIDRGNEPMILGRLVHPHIVWVNSVSYQPETRLRGLSMPYLPGLPLDEIVRGLDPASLPRRAGLFWDALVADRGPDPQASPEVAGNPPDPGTARKSLIRNDPSGDGWKGFPIRGSYAQGVAWIGRVLAEALHHAHSKRTFHRDIKPGNVLMTLSRGPQLLDFNLAESPHSAERADDALRGGTLPYMAPEQIGAFLDPTAWERVGASADLYSLGLVLWELLTGRLPDLPDERLPRSRALADFLDRRACLDLSIRRFNPSVPHALEAIIARCLAVQPEARYADASALAADLGSFLERRPLKFARNPCRRERLANWLNRNCRSIELGIAGTVVMSTFLNPLPAELTPAFTKAVHAYGRNHFDEAIGPLKRLAAGHPRSPLPELFLGLARDKSNLDHRPAEESFRKAMAIPGAVPIIVAWAKAHPEVGLAIRLDKFSQRCLRVVSGDDADDTATSGPRSPQERASVYRLARQASELAFQIDPGPVISLHTIATHEESQGHLEVAFGLVSQCLSNFRGHDPHDERGERVSLLLSRSRIALNWAARLRARGDRDAWSEAGNLLTNAIADLDQGDRLGISWHEQRYKAFYFRLMASLSLAEMAFELDRIDDARRYQGVAGEALDRLIKLEMEIGDLPKIRLRLVEMARRIKAAALISEGTSIPPGTPAGPAVSPDRAPHASG